MTITFRKWLLASIWICLISVSIFQCKTQEPEDENRVLITIEADKAYLKFGKIWVGLIDSSGQDTTTLWNMDSLSSVEQLRKIPISVPEGGTFKILVRGYESGSGKLIYEEARVVDATTGELISHEIPIDSKNLVRKRIPVGLHSIDSLVSINDTIRLFAMVEDTMNSVVSFAWSLEGSGKFGPEFAFEDGLDSIPALALFKNPGRFPILFRIKTVKKTIQIDTLWTEIVEDPPLVDVGPDQVVTVGDSIRLHSIASDFFGSIVRSEWRKIEDKSIRFSSADTFYMAPDSIGIDVWVCKVIDDDGISTEDTVKITIQYRHNALLSRLEIPQVQITPGFSGLQTSYSASVPYSQAEIELRLSKEDPEASIRVGDVEVGSDNKFNVPLSVGGNLVRISVTAQNKTEKMEYALLINRMKNKDATLNDLIVNPGILNPKFSKDSLIYRVILASDQNSLSLIPRASDSGNARIFVQGVPKISGKDAGPITVNTGIDTVRIEVEAQDDSISRLYKVLASRIPSRNALLRSLEVSVGSVVPEFASVVIDYAIALPSAVTEISFRASAIDKSALITINGNSTPQDVFFKSPPLSFGENIFRIKILSESGDSGIYQVKVWRRSNNSALKLLEVDKGRLMPAFVQGISSYSDTVKGSIEKIQVTANAADSNAKSVKIMNALGPSHSNAVVSLVTGSNPVPIKVTAEDGQVSDYLLTIYRQSSDDSLKYLETSAGAIQPSFAPGIRDYMITVANAVTDLTFKATASAHTAGIMMNGAPIISGISTLPKSLLVGDNRFNFLVSSESGDTLSYTLIVHRKSADAGISSLKVDAGILNPVFAPSTTLYSDTVPPGTNSVKLSVEASAKSVQSVTINGNTFSRDTASIVVPISPFSVPIRVNIVVKSEDGNEMVYSVTIRSPGFFRTFGGGFDDEGFTIVQMSDGGFAAVGLSMNAAKVYQMKLIRTNSDGDTLWTRTFGNNSVGNDMIRTLDNGFVLAGYLLATATRGYCVYLVRTDALGNIIWEKTFGGDKYNYATSIVPTDDGGFVVAGARTDKNFSFSQALLLKTNSAGDSLWSMTYGDTTASKSLISSCLTKTNDGGFLITGMSAVDGTYQYPFLLKANSSGFLEWQKKYFSAGLSAGNKVINSPSGGYYVVGQKNPESSNIPDGYVLRTNSLGDSLDLTSFGTSGATNISDISPTSDGGYALFGTTSTQGAGGVDFLLMKTDINLNLSWSKPFGGSGTDTPISGFQTTSGGYIMLGSTVSFGAGKTDWLMIKADSQGNVH
jgi:hypothetical protein